MSMIAKTPSNTKPEKPTQKLMRIHVKNRKPIEIDLTKFPGCPFGYPEIKTNEWYAQNTLAVVTAGYADPASTPWHYIHLPPNQIELVEVLYL